MTGAVPGLSLFSKTIRPRNLRADSACSLITPSVLVNKSKVTSHMPFHLLSFAPCQALDALPCYGNDPVSPLRIVRKQVVIVLRNCANWGVMRQRSAANETHKNLDRKY